MKFKSQILLLSLIGLIFSCATFKELKSLSNCEFEYESISEVNLVGIEMKKFTNFSQIKLADILLLTKALKQPEFPVNFILNVNVSNPNHKLAAINKLEWKGYIDGIMLAEGVVNERIEVLPGKQTILPLNISMDLKKVFAGESLNSIVNFALNLSDKGIEPTRMQFKVRPSFVVGKKTISYGDFITVKTKVKSK